MATYRDMDQMLKCGLELKEKAQKVIDFAKMNGAGEGSEGEEDLEELPDEEGYPDEEEEGMINKPVKKEGKDSKKALLIAVLNKKLNGKKK